MLSFLQIERMDFAVHQMSNAVQRLVIATGGVADEKLRAVTSEAVREFSAAKDAYRAAKEGNCEAVFRAPATDANGGEVAEEVA